MEQRESNIFWKTLNHKRRPVIKHKPFGPPNATHCRRIYLLIVGIRPAALIQSLNFVKKWNKPQCSSACGRGIQKEGLAGRQIHQWSATSVQQNWIIVEGQLGLSLATLKLSMESPTQRAKLLHRLRANQRWTTLSVGKHVTQPSLKKYQSWSLG